MTALATALAESGILDPAIIQQFQKWGLPVIVPEKTIEFDASVEDVGARVVAMLQKALEDSGYEITKETDLEAVRSFLLTQKLGKLVVVIEEQTATFDVMYGINRIGEYMIPWRTDGVQDVLTNGQTHLITTQGDYSERVFFKSVHELFFGDTKSFMACEVSAKEKVEESREHS